MSSPPSPYSMSISSGSCSPLKGNLLCWTVRGWTRSTSADHGPGYRACKARDRDKHMGCMSSNSALVACIGSHYIYISSILLLLFCSIFWPAKLFTNVVAVINSWSIFIYFYLVECSFYSIRMNCLLTVILGAYSILHSQVLHIHSRWSTYNTRRYSLQW